MEIEQQKYEKLFDMLVIMVAGYETTASSIFRTGTNDSYMKRFLVLLSSEISKEMFRKDILWDVSSWNYHSKLSTCSIKIVQLFLVIMVFLLLNLKFPK